MSKTLKKILISTASLVMLASTSAGISNMKTHASTNPNRYGIVIFPTKQTHYNFAYQMRDRGHHSKIFLDNIHSRIGYDVFGKLEHKVVYSHGAPKTDYARYLYHHYPMTYKQALRELEHVNIRHQNIHSHYYNIKRTKHVKRTTPKGYMQKRNDQIIKRHVRKTHTHKSNKAQVIEINAKYNKHQVHQIVNMLHKRYPHLSYRRDIVYNQGHHEQWGYIIGLNNNHATKDFMWKIHQYNYSRISPSYKNSHPGLTHWFNHNVVQNNYRGHKVIPQSVYGNSVLEHYQQKHGNAKAIEILSATVSQIVGRD